MKKSDKLGAELRLMRHRNWLRRQLIRAANDGDMRSAKEIFQEVATEEKLDREEFPHLTRRAK